MDDLVGVIHHALENVGLRGPVNAVTPNSVTNQEFTKILGQAVSRPAFFALPSFAARIAFGQMADEVLLSSARVAPVRLNESGYKFQFPALEGALSRILPPTKA